jgi:hypothetical protein
MSDYSLSIGEDPHPHERVGIEFAVWSAVFKCIHSSDQV